MGIIRSMKSLFVAVLVTAPLPGYSITDTTLEKLAGVDVCDTSGDLSKPGPYKAVARKPMLSYSIYGPKTLGPCKHPVVAFAPGIGTPTLLYNHIFTHLASHGFVVLVDNNIIVNSPGYGLTNGIKNILESPDYKKYLTGTAGVMGHSMGGGAALNASGRPVVDALVTWMPGVSWSVAKKPGLFIGGGLDFMQVITNPNGRYRRSPGDKFLLVSNKSGHFISSTIFSKVIRTKASRSFLGATAGWFRCYLAADEESCDLFRESHKDSCAFEGDWRACKGSL